MNMVTSCLPFANIYYDLKGIYTAANQLSSKINNVSQDKTWKKKFQGRQYERAVASLNNKFIIGLLLQITMAQTALLVGSFAVTAILTVGVGLSVAYMVTRPMIKQKIEDSVNIPKPAKA